LRKFYPAFLLALLLYLPKLCLGQNELATKDLLFFKNHIAFTAGLNHPLLGLNNVTGGHSVKIFGRPGGFMGLRFIGNLHPNFGIETGMQVGLKTFGFQFNGDGNFGTSHTWATPYLAFPLLFSPRVLIKERHLLGLQSGITVHYYIPLSNKFDLDANGEAPGGEIFEMDFNVLKKNPFVDIDFGVNYGLVLKNLNILRFSLNYSMGSKVLLQGEYVYRENDFIKEKGQISANNSYVSLQFDYIFTRAQRMKNKMAFYNKTQRSQNGY
jgi:hypothetical protein